MNSLIVDRDAPGGIRLATTTPEPSVSEALVRVSAATVNPTDLHFAAQAPHGAVIGYEVAGTIDVPASDGSSPAAGTRVAGLAMGGAWAEYAAVPGAQLAVIPDHLDFDTAATVPLAGASALRALRALGSTLGRRVLITGATGAVGRIAVQLAAASGAAEIAAVARDEQAFPLLRELGATSTSAVIGSDLGIFDGVIDNVGGPALRDAFALLASNGTLVSVGRASGEDVVLSATDLQGDWGGSGRTIRTFFMPEEGGPDLQSDFEFLINLAATGRLHTNIGERVSLSRGLDILRTGAWKGKLVLQPQA
ncbi:zinc-binding dehydrogenase [Arthrobacter zhaoguopingii]|uniref:zinc-binding dehydrogenase n=1 Tax=Arthrobacter zhaoguopingii TaxID=2681491 RepID=UPI00135C2220|nr:zinc-binding dehydrogenase [Arthrobacter zhaoguopingii]